MNRTFSVPEWHRLAQDGTKIPVRIPLSGWSMEPLIRMNKDIVTSIPLEEIPQIGDIVLFADQKQGRYVVHRVWSLNDGKILTWGDNCPAPDNWLPLEDVWGKAVLIERGKRKIQPNPAKGMKWAGFWHWAGTVYRPYIRFKNAVRDKIDRMRAWVKK